MNREQTQALVMRISRSYDDGLLTGRWCPRIRVFNAAGNEMKDVAAVDPVEGYAWIYLRNPETGQLMVNATGDELVQERIRLVDPEYELFESE